MTVQNFIRVTKVSIGQLTFTNKNLKIEFRAPFDSDPDPNTTTIKIWNLSPNTLNKIHIGDICTLQAGYEMDFGVIGEGRISSITTKWDSVDKITTIKYLEGNDYSKIWVSAKTATKSTVKYHKDGTVVKNALAIKFRKGTDGLTIIKRLTSALGMKLDGPIKLRRNKIYKKGYTCTKKILNDLETVVEDCGAIIYQRRGKHVIRLLNEGFDENFTIKSETGLISSPTSVDDGNFEAIEVKMSLQYRITTCSIIRLEANQIKGKYRAYKGEHVCEGSDFYTTFKAR